MKKKIALLLGLTLGFTAISCVLPFSKAAAAGENSKVKMFRLYNPNSGEHFFTGNEEEKTNLVNVGWNDEGIGWIAPLKSSTPVYRLYNGNAGDHHYTLKAEEKDFLISVGWTDEGIGWYSDDNKTVPLYREYNPNALTGTHNYTADKAEHNNLLKAGWKDEGIGWYAVEKKPLEIGDTVLFGAYEQDNNSSNGKEEIEWKVLAKDGNNALVISRYALDCQPYNTTYTSVTWETCSLRKWLNESFIINAFSSEEQKKIQTTTVTADKNPDFNTSPGNNTKDKAFLLSIKEANKYFSSYEASYCVPTEYAKAQGVPYTPYEFVGDQNPCWWWLRSPSGDSRYAAFFFTGDGAPPYEIEYGHLRICGSEVNFELGVRPALWINLGS